MKLSVIGPGRAGTAIHQQACAAGVASSLGRVADPDADILLLAVPDSEIAAVAATLPVGPAVGMLSGAAPLGALAPHTRRFVMHPMQTIQPERADLQLTGCPAGVTAVDEVTTRLATELATTLGMVPVLVEEAQRPLPHIACVFASNLLLAPLLAAMRVLDAAGLGERRDELLRPLILRTIDNALAAGIDAQPTGPVARGDAATVRAHRDRLRSVDPTLDRTYALLSTALLPFAPDAAGSVALALGPEL